METLQQYSPECVMHVKECHIIPMIALVSTMFQIEKNLLSNFLFPLLKNGSLYLEVKLKKLDIHLEN
jgi:hypothetical protein